MLMVWHAWRWRRHPAACLHDQKHPRLLDGDDDLFVVPFVAVFMCGIGS